MYATRHDPKIYPHTKFRIPTSNYIQISFELDLARTETRGQGHSDLETFGDSRVKDVSTYQIWNATINKIGDLLWVHFFQELPPEIKVTVDENSERHSMTTTYIHKLNLEVIMAYIMRHALTGLAQTWKNLALVLEKSAFCPAIVLEFCKIILENMN